VSDQQAAFARAAEARQAIDAVIDSLRSGDVDLASAFLTADTNPLVGRCFAVKVLEAVPGIGKVRARRTMQALDLEEGVWLDQVPPETRVAVIEAFAQPVPS
jgi:hypothetical protein